MAARALESFARELDTLEMPTRDLEAEICTWVSMLARTLKPEYAEALEAIEVGGTPVKAFAEQKGLSPSHAAVRVFRPRRVEDARLRKYRRSIPRRRPGRAGLRVFHSIESRGSWCGSAATWKSSSSRAPGRPAGLGCPLLRFLSEIGIQISDNL